MIRNGTNCIIGFCCIAGLVPSWAWAVANKKFRVYEVPISYSGRSYDEGKKIGLKDAFIAIYCVIKYRYFD